MDADRVEISHMLNMSIVTCDMDEKIHSQSSTSG